MPDNLTLVRQLANRARSFHKITGVTQSQLASAIGMSDGNYSNFLAGKKGLGAEATCLLLKFTNMSVRQAIATFSKPVPTSRIMELQEQGRHLQLDNSGWTPGVGDRAQGADPNGSTPMDATPDADTGYNQNDVDLLKGLLGMNRQAIRKIKGYLQTLDVRAKVNRDGTTAPNNQRFSTGQIARFATIDDVRDSQSVKDLITVIAGLPDSVRKQVIALILQKFPNSH
jgi:transcriptional regulator with XRE-family HTH domain